MPRPMIDISGVRFGRWTAIRPCGSDISGRVLFWCKCDCGAERPVVAKNLRKGRTTSCGCGIRERNTKHGMHASSTYRAWNAMKARCECSSRPRYADYGGRGIKVCDRWRNSFENFYADMGDKPEGMSLDRINNDGNYEPGNCRWATPKQQSMNKRRTRNITAFGETKCIAEWANDSRCQVTASGITERIDKGWTPEDAISLPPRSLVHDN